MDWTKENILEFIDLYKETTVLWDPKDPFHYNKVKKNEAWEDIAREIGRSADECRKKMEYLLAALRREKMKIRSSLVNGKDHKITWFAFDSLKFLLEERKSRKGADKVPGYVLYALRTPSRSIRQAISQLGDVSFNSADDRDFDDDSSVLVFKHGHDYADKSSSSPNIAALMPAAKRARTDASDADWSSASLSEVTHFANYVSSKLEAYSTRTRSAVQHAISNILFVADLGQFDYMGQNPYTGGGEKGVPSRKGLHGSAASSSQRTQAATPTQQTAAAAVNVRLTTASAAAGAAAASSQSEHEVSASQTQSYQELFDSNNFEDDEGMEKKDMEDGHQQVEIIVT